ncbi:MAG: hypothetical protein ABIH04_03355 [Planctomycetota bacterium]
MKRRNYLAALVSFAFLFFASVGAAIAQPGESIDDAAQIELDKPAEAKIAEKGQVNWYAFDVAKDGYVEVSAANVPGGIGVVAGLYGGDKKHIANAWLFPVKPGKYYLSISDDRNDAASPQAFSITVKFTDSAKIDRHEPNNDIKSAKMVELDKPFDGAIVPVGDVDFFKFKVEKPGYVEAIFQKWPQVKDLSPVVYYYSADGTQIRKRGDVRLEPGEYYVSVCDSWNDRYSLSQYTLTLKFTPEMDLHEPNNDTKSAKMVELDKPFDGAIATVGDIDFFKFTMEKPGYVEAQFQKWPDVKDLSPVIYYYSADGTRIRERGEVRLEAGEYFVSVCDGWNDRSSLSQYTLTLKFTPEMDLHEPNNDTKSAKMVELDKPFDGAIAPVGDVDFYKFKVEKPGYVEAQFQKWPQVKDLSAVVYYFSADGTRIRDRGEVRLEPGEYYVSVRDGWDDRYSFSQYTLTLKFTPEMDLHEPNNDTKTAKTVELDKPFDGAIAPVGDVDFFKFKVEKPGYVEAQFQKWPQVKDLNPVVYYYSADGKQIRERGDVRLEPGEYFVMVCDGWNDRYSLSQYTLTLKFTPEMDLHESNNDTKSAKAIEFWKPVTGAIAPGGDVDVFKFKVTEPGYVGWRFGRWPKGIDSIVQLFSSDGKPIKSQAFISLEPGEYYLSLQDGWDDRYSFAPYSFTLTFYSILDTDEAKEPNDSVEKAVPISLGDTVKTFVFPPGDKDFFKLDVPEKGLVRIEYNSVPENVTLETVFCDAEGKRVIQGRTWLYASPGTVYFSIGASEDGYSADFLSFTVRFQSAAEIELDRFYDISIIPYGENDLFLVKVPVDGFLMVDLKDAPSDLQACAMIADGGENVIQEWMGLPFDKPTAFYARVRPGECFVHVCSADQNANNSDTFPFIVRLVLPPEKKNTRLQFVGFKVGEYPVAKFQLDLSAAISGGRFYTAESAEELVTTMEEAVEEAKEEELLLDETPTEKKDEEEKEKEEPAESQPPPEGQPLRTVLLIIGIVLALAGIVGFAAVFAKKRG